MSEVHFRAIRIQRYKIKTQKLVKIPTFDVEDQPFSSPKIHFQLFYNGWFIYERAMRKRYSTEVEISFCSSSQRGKDEVVKTEALNLMLMREDE